MDEQQEPGRPDNLESLLESVRRRVQERRAAGDYPPGLEVDLETHFRRIVETRPGPDRSRFQAQLDRLAAFSSFSTERIPMSSNLPGGTAVHRAVAKVTSRQIRGILDQIQQFATAVRDVLDTLADPAAPSRHLVDHEHPELAGTVDALVERVASYERAPDGSAASLADLYRRVEELERREARRQFRPWFGRARLDDELGGSWDEVRDRVADLARQLVGAAPVLDVGCGRGELLGALRDLGVDASGVESDPSCVEEARARGLGVEEGDELDHLAGIDDASLGAVVVLHVIEDFTAQETAQLVLLARDKLRPGGRLVVETANPESLDRQASRWLDPAHDRLVHPAYLEFLAREAGFARVEVLWRSQPSPEDVSDQGTVRADDARASGGRRLNRLLSAPPDYALIATR